MRLRSVLLSAMAKFWWWLRQVTGDAAYENYLGLASRRSRTVARTAPNAARHANGCELHGSGSHGSGVAITREQFYVDRLRRKYAKISRCC